MMPPEEDMDFLEEDNMFEDEEALEVLREMESGTSPKRAPIIKSPACKKPRLENVCPSIKRNILNDLTNFMEEDETDAEVYQIPRMGERKIYRRIPVDGDYQSLTMSDGERFYVRLNGENDDEKDVTNVKTSSYAGLCGLPYTALLEQAIQEQLRIKENTSMKKVKDDDSGIDSSSSEDESSVATLWVEKFRPKSYMQLLSDDGTNRTLLTWLKLWDKVVYGKEVPKKPSKAGPDGEPQKFQFHSNNEVIDEYDPTGRPQQKTALLHGPPGLGKTTLAHVVASHAGYNVVEINASDDRSLQAFKVKLDAATQMKSVSNADQRPNCLIIDEIDGAPAPTINYLVNLLSGKAAGNKKKKAATELLSRPIICICNDLYVPALRPLRQMSLLLPFPETNAQRLAQRLSQISQREHLKTDMTALMALCEKSQNDIRSCLSTLQFFKSRGLKLTSYDVHKTFVGNKDTQKSHFTVWQDIFQIPRPVKRKYVSLANSTNDDNTNIKEENSAALDVRFRNVLRNVQSCGDYEKLQQGVFENYLNVKFKDTKFHNLVKGQDFCLFFDIMQQHIKNSQNYSVMAYYPFNFVAFHMYYAAFGKVKINYPATFNEKKMALQRSDNVIESLYSDMTAKAKCFSSKTSLTRDVLPCLLEIMKPNLRPVNTQLYTKSEKENLQNLVAVLLTYSLNYVQEKTPDGQYIYKLDPNIEDVAHFQEINHNQLPYAIKQLIAHEVTKEKMRRSEPAAVPETASTKNVPSKDDKPKNEEELPSHLRQKLTAKKVEVKEHVPVDFFGRKIVPKEVDAEKDAKPKNEIIISDVWFKFKEGYNNAVRRTIRMKDML